MKTMLAVLAGLFLGAGLALAGDAPAKDVAKCDDNGGRESGLVAHYFKDPTEWDGNWKEGAKPTVDAVAWTFREYRYSRIEPLVNHQFIRRGWFSVRWVGSIDLNPANSDGDKVKAKVKAKGEKPPATEPAEVEFEVWADDGARLFIDGVKLIDDWRACAETDADSHRKAKVTLTPGPHKIVVEYFQGESLQNDDKDPAKLYWTIPALKVPHQIVPAAHLSHTAEDLLDYEPSTKAEGDKDKTGGKK